MKLWSVIRSAPPKPIADIRQNPSRLMLAGRPESSDILLVLQDWLRV